MGFEPATHGLQNRCSTIELHRRVGSYHNDVNPYCQQVLREWFYLKVCSFYQQSDPAANILLAASCPVSTPKPHTGFKLAGPACP